MGSVDARLVMALYRLTGLPIRECQALLVAEGGDFEAVVQLLRRPPWFLPDAELRGVVDSLRASGALPPPPDGLTEPDAAAPAAAPISEQQFVADYVDVDIPLERYFLLGEPGRQGVACWHTTNGLMACLIEDDKAAAACVDFLRRRGHPVFASLADVYAHAARMRWPGWERNTSAGPAVAG